MATAKTQHHLALKWLWGVSQTIGQWEEALMPDN